MSITELRPAVVSVRPRGLPGPPGRDGTNGTNGAAGAPGDAIHFGSVALAKLASVPSPQQFFTAAGYGVVGDGGEELYGKVSTPSSVKSYHVQTADGAWWAPTRRIMNLKSVGCKIDGATPDTNAFSDAIALQIATGRTLFHPGGTLLINSKIQPGDGFSIFGTGISGSEIKAAGLPAPLFQCANAVLPGSVSQRNFNWLMRDLKINNTTRNAAGGIALDLRNVTDGRFDNLWLTNVETGLQGYGDATFGGAFYNEASKILISTCATGMFIGGEFNENEIAGRCVDISGAAVVISGGSHNDLRKFSAEAFGTYGFNISGAAYDTQLFSPRCENSNGIGTGIRIASAAVRTALWAPQYIALGTNLDNQSNSTRINGLRRFPFTGLAVGTLAAGTTDVFVSIGSDVTVNDWSSVILPPTLASGVTVCTIPANNGVYLRFSTAGTPTVGTISGTIVIGESGG